MNAVLFTSGFLPPTLQAMHARWGVIDLPRHKDALDYLQACEQLPLAVVVGHARAPMPAAEEDGVPTPPSSDGLAAHDMLARALALDVELPVIVSTAMAESDAIVYLIKQGAFDYVIEPRQRTPEAMAHYTQRLVRAVARAVRWRKVVLENRRLHSGLSTARPTLLGSSGSMQRVHELIARVAPTPATVLVVGESGTGKELVAREIHQASSRRDQPFVGLNCGTLEDTLLRSELFGHERGAFTGADRPRPGLIREAGQGTLFLDEIATVSMAFQISLLRVLEERVARPVGGQGHYPMHCRVIAASNRNLAQMVRRGEFREDLYYRLNVFQIHLPPLRERRGDISLLARHFLDRLRPAYGKPEVRCSPAAMETLERYQWPGNVRELRNVIERALILCNEQEVRPADLGLNPSLAFASGAGSDESDAPMPPLKEALTALESRLIRQALERSDHNLTAAAALLGIKRPTLHYRMRHLGLEASRPAMQ